MRLRSSVGRERMWRVLVGVVVGEGMVDGSRGVGGGCFAR